MGCILKGGGGLYARVTVGAVLLAAGAGSRLGHRPKSLLELGGVPLIRRQLIALSGAGVDEVVVVTGHHASAIEAVVQDFPITLARNPRPEDGQASSVRVGLQALSARLDAVIVALADQPLVNSQDIGELIGAFKKRGGAAMAIPRVDGQPGNPVIFENALREEWLAGDANAACRRWRDAHPDRVHWFDSDNQRFRIDIDTEDDLRRFAQRTGHVLSWPAHLALADVPTAAGNLSS
jgi:molybdenum cofactor cytidylyltransferase